MMLYFQLVLGTQHQSTELETEKRFQELETSESFLFVSHDDEYEQVEDMILNYQNPEIDDFITYREAEEVTD